MAAGDAGALVLVLVRLVGLGSVLVFVAGGGASVQAAAHVHA